MREQRAAGAIIFSPQRQAFLLLKHRDGHWEFPKGKLEGEESEKDAMRREVAEETGISEGRLLPFREETQYSFWHNGKIEKTVIYFLLLSDEQAEISDEHRGYRWVDAEKAEDLVHFGEHKRILQKAVVTLRKQGALGR